MPHAAASGLEHRWRNRPALSVAMIASLFLGGSEHSVARAAAPHCQAGVNRRAGDPFGYQMQDSSSDLARCEGTFIAPFSAGPLALVSLTLNAIDFPSRGVAEVVLEWRTSVNEGLHIAATDLHPDLFYRMDRRPSAGEDRFRWPARLLMGLQPPIAGRNLGVVAYRDSPFNGQTRRVFVPLRVSWSATASPTPRQASTTDGYQATLLSDTRVKDLVLVTQVLNLRGTPQGKEATRQLPQRSAASQEPISFRIAPFQGAFLYVEVSGKAIDGEVVTGFVVEQPHLVTR